MTKKNRKSAGKAHVILLEALSQEINSMKEAFTSTMDNTKFDIPCFWFG